MEFLSVFALLLIVGGSFSETDTFDNASTQFSLNFFRAAYNLNPSRNCVVSPIAIQHTLAMLQHAAKRNESSHLQSLLGFPGSTSSPSPTKLNNNALEMITKVFHSQVELNPNLLPVLQAEYSVDVQVADFSRPEQVVSSVNRWASRFTNGLVGDVFNGAGYSRDANLMIINTVTLNASWEHPFYTSSLQKSDFQFLNGVRKVDMMRTYKGFRYCEIDDLRIVELAYKKTADLSMLIIKSDSQPLEKVVERLDLEMYRSIDERLYEDRFKLTIPKFTISRGIGAKWILKAMGLNDVFGKDAFNVFVGFSSRLANVYQALRFDIDENGTRAAAGTYSDKWMRVGTDSKYVVDGPFIFVIRKDSTKEIVFIGHYSSYVE
ncbi:leukocyte elastase inhibitor-like [Aedes albopictus]|uniref:Serpin domain-containing protein n=1 Tax=Aedes albopictus TaxID=7160 RepID=A0ABM1YL39_AEDAL|nr:leukocyte elastase inhibitor-like [Aedes albopictus]